MPAFQQAQGMQAVTVAMFDEVERQLARLARAAASSAPPPEPFIVPPPLIVEIPIAPQPAVHRQERRGAVIVGVLVAVFCLGAIVTLNILHLIDSSETLRGKAAVDAVAVRILAAESRGAAELKNARSSATGPAQFLDDTWLELIRATRPDLMKSRTRDELLDLRHDHELAREIAARFAERNAAMLKRRGLPVTAGTLYLAHFAGPAGAAALLLAPDMVDAATVMAKADASGKATREQIVKANPFLDKFTVADVRRWAERKMEGPALVLTELFSANTKK
ncbi:MAG: lytic transglycosylase domain-containing protein [Pseudolabrys sp.]